VHVGPSSGSPPLPGKAGVTQQVGGLMFGRFLLAIVILQLARAACTQEADDGKCKTCGVTIGQDTWCSECNGANYAPVNGVCEDVETQADKKALCKAHASGACTTCGGNSFMYKDGCYSSGEGLPGHSLCLSSDGDGVCTEAAPGYFAPVGAANTEQSVIACGDTTGVAIAAGGNTYKGVADCASCAPPSNNQGPVLCYLMNGDSPGGSTNKSGLSTGAIAGISVAVIVVVAGLVGFLCWWFICRGKA
ncbi:Variant-specific surface protein, partial [Giardia duodenalis]